MDVPRRICGGDADFLRLPRGWVGPVVPGYPFLDRVSPSLNTPYSGWEHCNALEAWGVRGRRGNAVDVCVWHHRWTARVASRLGSHAGAPRMLSIERNWDTTEHCVFSGPVLTYCVSLQRLVPHNPVHLQTLQPEYEGEDMEVRERDQLCHSSSWA